MSDTKQHTAEFEKCVTQVMEQGHEKSSAFAICTKSFQDAGKPIFIGESEKQKLHLFCESFKLEGNRVSGVAIHPKRLFHPEEQMAHVYLREELERAAPTLAGKPFGIDHVYVLPPPNIITKSWYCADENGVCFEGFVDDYIAEKIRRKAFKGISIELDWLRPGGSVEYVNGVAAKNFELTSLHLLQKFPPADVDAFIKLWNSIREQLVVTPPKPLDEQMLELRQDFENFRNEINERLARIEGALGQVTVPPSPLGLKNPAKAKRGMKMKEQNQNQEPEKDEHGCIIGKERHDEETGKCVPLETPAQESMKEQPEVEQCVLDGIGLGLSNAEIAEKCNVSLITVQEIRGGFVGLYETLKKLREQQGNQEPEKDAHGCVIGKERYNDETEKCVAITAEAQAAFLEAKLSLKEQEDEVTVDEIKAKIAELTKQKEELDAKLYPESELSEDEKTAVRTQIELMYAEIQAYEQALATKIAGQAAPPETPPPAETPVKAESLVALRKKLVEVEATLIEMEKQQKRKAATWKEKYETLREAVKGAIPVNRVWRSWSTGPQRYVQENLKILRETESES